MVWRKSYGGQVLSSYNEKNLPEFYDVREKWVSKHKGFAHVAYLKVISFQNFCKWVVAHFPFASGLRRPSSSVPILLVDDYPSTFSGPGTWVSNNYFIFQNPLLAVKRRIIHGIPKINIPEFLAGSLETSYIIKPFTIFVFFSPL